jgi:hypothetical protein
MIRPTHPRLGTYFGLTNQIGFVISGLKEAEKKKVTKVTIGVLNKDIFNVGYVPFNTVFDLSSISFEHIKEIEYEQKLPIPFPDPGHDFALLHDFDPFYCKALQFSKEIKCAADKLISSLPPFTAIIHSKLEEDTFDYYSSRKKEDKKIYEEDLINQYTSVTNRLPEGNWLILSHFKHDFWNKFPNVVIPQKMSEDREISAAIEMCTAVKLLENPSVHFVFAIGSSFDHFINLIRKENNPWHTIYLGM